MDVLGGTEATEPMVAGVEANGVPIAGTFNPFGGTSTERRRLVNGGPTPFPAVTAAAAGIAVAAEVVGAGPNACRLDECGGVDGMDDMI